MGLKPGGTEGYRLPVGLRVLERDAEHSSFALLRNGSAEKLAVPADVSLAPNVDGSAPVAAGAVFVGYGFAVPPQHFDDLAGIDLRGKIAVFYAGAPASVHGPLRAYFRTASERWKQLQAAGAIGMIAIAEVRQAQAGPARVPGARPAYVFTDPSLNLLPGLRLNASMQAKSAAPLFAGSPHPLDEILELAKTGKPLPKFPLAVSVEATTAVKQTAQFDPPDVVGLLEGSDPQLKAQYVVVSAHLDHLGKGQPVNGDAIYNGAMDNASGIASMIEVAKQLAAGPRPRRSICCSVLRRGGGRAWIAVLRRAPAGAALRTGSRSQHGYVPPAVPLRYLEVQGLAESSLGNDARAAAQLHDVEVQFDKQPDENRFVRSDQMSFVRYGIPALAFKLGWLPDSPEGRQFNDWVKTRYHQPSDDLAQPIDRSAAGAVRTRCWRRW